MMEEMVSGVVSASAGECQAASVPSGLRHFHRPGRHCGSSAVRDILEFHGLNLTESFCFGLGSGLGITYVELPGKTIPFIVHVRSMGFEEKVFDTLGVPFGWSTFPDQESASAALERSLTAGRPALLLTDIYHLPYFNSGTHFPGHAIVAWHLCDGGETVLVSDTERPDLLPVPRQNLANARFSLMPPFIHHGNLFAPETLDLVVVKERVLGAIIHNATTLREGSRHSGLQALDTWINDLPRWRAQNNWQWLLRFAYQVIEKRGTGGGGFRLMYAEFLREVEVLMPSIQRFGLPALMDGCAAAWSMLASVLREASEADHFPEAELTSAIRNVRNAESTYVRVVSTLS